MDERHGAGTHSSTLRGRGRAGKLTQAGERGCAARALLNKEGTCVRKGN